MDTLLHLKCAEGIQAAYDRTGINIGEHSFTVTDYDGLTLINIAGTNNLENLMEDAFCMPIQILTGDWTHGGCVLGYNILHDAVLDHIRHGQACVLSGHSEGGGIAQIFSRTIGIKAITFGSLRTWYRYQDGPITLPGNVRYENENDPIPGVPRMFYRHIEPPFRLLGGSFDLQDPFKFHHIPVYKERVEHYRIN